MCLTITIWVQRASQPTVSLIISSPYTSLPAVSIGTIDGCKFILEFGCSVSCCQQLVCEGGYLVRLIGNYFFKSLNIFLSVVVEVATFSRVVVVSCTISFNVSMNESPHIATLSTCARVP